MATIGRPPKYTEAYCDKALEYLTMCIDTFEVVGENRPTIINKVKLPTIEGLANYLGVHRDTVYDWEQQHEAFSDIVTRVRQEQATRLIDNGLSGTYNPQIAKVLLSKHGYSEKIEQDLNHSGDVSFINSVPRPKSE